MITMELPANFLSAGAVDQRFAVDDCFPPKLVNW